MLDITKKLIDDYYKLIITSQKLIAHISQNETISSKNVYDEYFNINSLQHCDICKKEMQYSGFKHGYKCDKRCESIKFVNNLTDDEIIDTVREEYNKNGFNKTFGLKFKKFELRLSPLFHNALNEELKYCVVMNILDKPICEVDNCYNKCKFSKTKFKYAKGCCNNHIMMTENHNWNDDSKNKMINSIKITRAQKLLENPNYFIEIGKKISNIRLNFSESKNNDINILRINTLMSKYGVDNISHVEEIKNKKKETLFKNYGVTSIWGLKHIISKIKHTNVTMGRWISDEQKSDMQKYYSVVWKFTRKQNLNELKNIDKRGSLQFTKDAHHLDHKFSIKEGFVNCILPHYIGNINNLEMLPASINCSKGAKCSISIDDLFYI